MPGDWPGGGWAPLELSDALRRPFYFVFMLCSVPFIFLLYVIPTLNITRALTLTQLSLRTSSNPRMNNPHYEGLVYKAALGSFQIHSKAREHIYYFSFLQKVNPQTTQDMLECVS